MISTSWFVHKNVAFLSNYKPQETLTKEMLLRTLGIVDQYFKGFLIVDINSYGRKYIKNLDEMVITLKDEIESGSGYLKIVLDIPFMANFKDSTEPELVMFENAMELKWENEVSLFIKVYAYIFNDVQERVGLYDEDGFDFSKAAKSNRVILANFLHDIESNLNIEYVESITEIYQDSDIYRYGIKKSAKLDWIKN